MSVAVEELTLEEFEAVSFSRGTGRWAIVLPGAGYSTQAPLLWYARRCALAAGFDALVLTDSYGRSGGVDPLAWVEERVTAALEHIGASDPAPLIVAKSLTTLAASRAAREGLPAIWLTPLIGSGSGVADRVTAGLRSGSAPRLLVGGTADTSWDGHVAHSLADAEILELAGADHALEVADDVERSLAYLEQVVQVMSRFTKRVVQAST
jgi:hypothetical protein